MLHWNLYLFLCPMPYRFFQVVFLILNFRSICEAQNVSGSDSLYVVIRLNIDRQSSTIAQDSFRMMGIYPKQLNNAVFNGKNDTLRLPKSDSFDFWVDYEQWHFPVTIRWRNEQVSPHILSIWLYTQEGIRKYLLEESEGISSKTLRRMKHLNIVLYEVDNFSIEYLGSVKRLILGHSRREKAARRRYIRWLKRNSRKA